MKSSTLYNNRMQVAALLVVLGYGCWLAAFAEPAYIVLAYIYIICSYMLRRVAVESYRYDAHG